MADEDIINDQFMVLEEETMQVADQVAAYQRKLMSPIWEKRREMVKQIPGFWTQTLGNSPLYSMDPSDTDIEALEHLTDFHVEYDEKKPDYRKISATFKKNDIFKNTTLVKEFSVDNDSTEGKVISKSTVEYHENKAPNKNKRKAAQSDDEDANISMIDWFGDDDVRVGIILSEDIFPSAVEYFQGPMEEIDEDDEEIDLGSEESDDDEEDVPKSKKSKN